MVRVRVTSSVVILTVCRMAETKVALISGVIVAQTASETFGGRSIGSFVFLFGGWESIVLVRFFSFYREHGVCVGGCKGKAEGERNTRLRIVPSLGGALTINLKMLHENADDIQYILKK